MTVWTSIACLKPALSTLVRPRRQAQTPAILDHSCALPQRDGPARPALDRGSVGCQRDLIILDASDVLDNALAVRVPQIDSEGEMRARYRHLPFPQCYHQRDLVCSANSNQRIFGSSRRASKNRSVMGQTRVFLPSAIVSR